MAAAILRSCSGCDCSSAQTPTRSTTALASSSVARSHAMAVVRVLCVGGAPSASANLTQVRTPDGVGDS